MKKMLFVLNPCAGKKKALRHLPKILDIFNRGGYDVQVYVTAASGDAIPAVQRLAPGMDLVVCCGGDGTFNETVSALLGAGLTTPVGYIPAGSTNDFANSLQLKTDCLKAAKQIVEGTPHVYDMGQFGDRYFSYVASFGAFTRVSYATPQSIKNALGHTAYLLEGVTELGRIKSIPIKLELDGELLEEPLLFGAICNSTSVGGILTLPREKVDMSDGLFEVMLVRKPHSLGEITECLSAVRKHTYNCAMMTFRTAKTIRAIVEDSLDWTLDGEHAPMEKEILIQNLHHAVTLMQ